GTAAVHIALGALAIEPGREVITSAITDMGSLTGVLYQLLIPRFADIDPETYNMDPASVEKLIGRKMGAILVVHHAGLPADIEAFVEMGRRHGILVIEDCAQAHHTMWKGRLVGTFADASTFSYNHFKHITTGSGGAVLTDRDDIEERIRLFIDTCYFRDGRKRNPYFLAPNYQMTELRGAVANAQLDKVQGIVERRATLGRRLIAGLAEIPGIVPQKIPEGAVSPGRGGIRAHLQPEPERVLFRAGRRRDGAGCREGGRALPRVECSGRWTAPPAPATL
ncbi:MAG: DegT/DnrJ/EryC1/StrS family aminotransferase, partial [Spirochaetes bacterium]|nr:DegT/DnrJ/EryC1/StrS family aminotransferase [Spirochaetota bacterium]